MSKLPARIWVNENQFIELNRGASMADLLREIAVRKNAVSFSKLNLTLPDPDSVLKKTGKDIVTYRELMVDAHVWAAVQSRKSGVLSMNWAVDRGKSLSRNAKFITSVFADLDMNRIISEILDAPLFGFQPLEVIWEIQGSQMVPRDIVAKPPEWFRFDSENKLRYAPPFDVGGMPASNSLGDELPPYKFLLPRYHARYDNPYGERVLSRVFWPVTFKKGGLKFWVTFSEKFGMPYLIGKHPRGIGETEIDAMADSLELMIQDAIAVIPDDSSVEVLESSSKTGSADVYKGLVEMCNGEISKAILGQTLTTEIGATGSYAASQTHMGVRQDIVEMDRRLVESTVNELIDWIITINFETAGERPRFILWQDEDVDKALAERDEILARTGVTFSREYFRKAYGFDDEDINIAIPRSSAPPSGAFQEGEPPDNMKDELDALVDSLSPADLQKQMELALESTLKAIRQGSSFTEVQTALAEQFPMMRTEDLERLMQRIIFISEIWGRVSNA